MSLSYAFLGLLERGAQHGYSLKREYDENFIDGRAMKFGQVYATLARLVRDGLAEIVAIEAGDGPDRRTYAITPQGVSELETWLTTPEPADQRALGPIYVKVVLALASGRSPQAILDGQRTVHLARMRVLRATHARAGMERQLALDLLIGHLQADLDWIELAAARLERGARRNLKEGLRS